MAKSRVLALTTFIAFAIWTTYLCHDYTFIGFFEAVVESGPGIQVLTDLCIAMTLVLIWMYHDAKKSHRRFWPYLLITIVVGSFGPLLYFILRKEKQAS